ncbi:amino acid permease [Thermomonas brevis]|uniref:Arginine/agmatine antiporter n=1 Tax=Thermomonas brevis TaxID=215691 RepID=A0A7G9QVH4_9GAMM|nr:amino acid permease [Thermomonas brevis]QNN47349.1 amino acid permease [Thermomonas brevis]
MSGARPLGTWSAIALVVGSMIGSGVFLLPSALAPYGGVSLLGWAITLFGALALALTFARLAMRWPQTGGPYAFARNAFGETPGFLVAWSYWVSIWSATAAIAVAFAGSMGALLPALVSTPLRAGACALASLWLCIAINLLGVREAGRTQVALTVLKFVPLALFAGIAIWSVDPAQFQPFNRSAESLPAATHACVALVLWALLGLEAATVPAGAIADPARTIPRATVIGTLLAGVATVLAVTAVIGIVPAAQLQDSAAPMADAARMLWGGWAGVGIAAVAAISCLGALNGWVLLSAQVPLAAAEDGLLPRAFARLDARGTPAFGIVASGLLASLLVAANFSRSLVQLFTFSILLSTAATLLPYLVGSAAWLLRGERRGRFAALFALAYSGYALFGAGGEALLWGAALLLAGLPVYAWMRAVRAR